MPQKCRICGCNDEDACLDEGTGQTCAWAEIDLCTFCAIAPAKVELYNEVECNRLINELRARRAGV